MSTTSLEWLTEQTDDCPKGCSEVRMQRGLVVLPLVTSLAMSIGMRAQSELASLLPLLRDAQRGKIAGDWKEAARLTARIVELNPVQPNDWYALGFARAAGVLQSQDVSGTWQGTLRVNARELRMVMKISNAPGGSLNALLYSIDQGGAPIPGSSVTLQGASVKASFPGPGIIYDGRLDTGGNSITGTFTQGAQVFPLNLTRATAESAWAIPEPVAALKPMAPDANPVFEVATIKLSRLDDPRLPTIQTQPRRLLTWKKSVRNLITFAFSLNPGEVLNGPDWLDTKYDIVAQPNGEGQPSQQQWQIMMQKLLAERFKLSYHRDKKEASIYVLTAAKNASKLLAPSASDPKGPPNLALPALGRFRATNATLSEFAGELQSFVDRHVLDQTGLSGRFDFSLNWTPDDGQRALLSGFPVPPRSNEEVPDLFTALQEQLGLKLDAAKAPIDVMVIEHIEKPAEN